MVRCLPSNGDLGDVGLRAGGLGRTSEGSKLHAWVIPTNEELLIARDTVRCILGEPHPS